MRVELVAIRTVTAELLVANKNVRKLYLEAARRFTKFFFVQLHHALAGGLGQIIWRRFFIALSTIIHSCSSDFKSSPAAKPFTEDWFYRRPL
jgi:hypothetical protein